MTEPRNLDQLAEILRDEQCARWERGERLSAEVLLQRHPALLDHPETALRLVYQEVLLRGRDGEVPQLDEYLRRFPQFAERLPPLFAVHHVLESERPVDSADANATLELNHDAATAELPGIPGYDILELLGRGGMGIVYKARQVGLNRLVALKMIRAGDRSVASERARFRAEAEAQARLQHPNIVQVHEVGEWRGCPYFVMEYADGGSLVQHLRGQPQAPRTAAALVETLAQAVQHAHAHGLVHRDLKPANILLSSSGKAEGATPKIADFGLAKRLDHADGLTCDGDVLGTPSYMAPEQAEGRTAVIGPAADVYALGVILYELLTGKPPLLGATALDTLVRVRTEDPVPPRRLVREVPRDLEAICLKCLRKEPSRRYPTAAALADDLQRFRAGQPVAARRVTVLERTWLGLRRRPLVALLALALLLVAASGAVSRLTGVLLVLSAGYVAVLSLWLQAERQREQAEDGYIRAEADVGRARRQQAQAETERFEAQQSQAHAEAQARRAVDQQRRTLHALRETNEVVGRQVAHLQEELAQSYLHLGNVLCQIDDYAEAATIYQKAVAIRERQTCSAPIDARGRSLLAVTWNNLGEALRQLERREEAYFAYLQAVAQQRRAVTEAREDAPYRAALSRHCLNLARVHRELGRSQEAVAACQEGIQTCAGEPTQLRLLMEELALCAAADAPSN